MCLYIQGRYMNFLPPAIVAQKCIHPYRFMKENIWTIEICSPLKPRAKNVEKLYHLKICQKSVKTPSHPLCQRLWQKIYIFKLKTNSLFWNVFFWSMLTSILSVGRLCKWLSWRQSLYLSPTPPIRLMNFFLAWPWGMIGVPKITNIRSAAWGYAGCIYCLELSHLSWLCW